jgi:hypothetical protein
MADLVVVVPAPLIAAAVAEEAASRQAAAARRVQTREVVFILAGSTLGRGAAVDASLVMLVERMKAVGLEVWSENGLDRTGR